MGVIQNATKWEEFFSLGTGAEGDGVKPKFGQYVRLHCWCCRFF